MTDLKKCRLNIGTSGYSYAEWIDCRILSPGNPLGEHAAALRPDAFPPPN